MSAVTTPATASPRNSSNLHPLVDIPLDEPKRMSSTAFALNSPSLEERKKQILQAIRDCVLSECTKRGIICHSLNNIWDFTYEPDLTKANCALRFSSLTPKFISETVLQNLNRSLEDVKADIESLTTTGSAHFFQKRVIHKHSGTQLFMETYHLFGYEPRKSWTLRPHSKSTDAEA